MSFRDAAERLQAQQVDAPPLPVMPRFCCGPATLPLENNCQWPKVQRNELAERNPANCFSAALAPIATFSTRFEEFLKPPPLSCFSIARTKVLPTRFLVLQEFVPPPPPRPPTSSIANYLFICLSPLVLQDAGGAVREEVGEGVSSFRDGSLASGNVFAPSGSRQPLPPPRTLWGRRPASTFFHPPPPAGPQKFPAGGCLTKHRLQKEWDWKVRVQGFGLLPEICLTRHHGWTGSLLSILCTMEPPRRMS